MECIIFMKKYEWPDNGKHIYKTKAGTYHVHKKYRDGEKIKTKHYGAFKDYNEAIRHRDKCIANNWDSSCVYKNPMRHIQKSGRKYHIQRRGEFYGAYSNIIDAMNERDLLEQYDWDICKVAEQVNDCIFEKTVFNGVRQP